MFRSHMLRIWKNTLSRVLLLLLLILPSLEIIQYYIDENKNVKSGGVFHIPKPVYAIFQSAELTQGLLHSIFFWFLPLFLLLIVADDTLADIKTGYYNILVLKAGRKKYCIEKVATSFLVSFGVIVCALLLNFILLHIFFRNGTASQIYEISLDMSYDDNPMFMWTVSHPYVTDAIFILLAGFISGIAGALGAAVALFVKERKAAYIITLVLWEILGMQRLSLFLIFQPYSEYVWQEYLQIFLCYIILFAGSAGLLLRHEIRRKEYIL